MNEPEARFSRILVKLSGEALLGAVDTAWIPLVLKRIAGEIRTSCRWACRPPWSSAAATSSAARDSRVPEWTASTADHMGMLATVMNSLAMQDALEGFGHVRARHVGHPHQRGLRGLHPPARRASPGEGPGGDFRGRYRQSVLHDRYRGVAARHRDQCRVLLKATKVNGVYSDDPVRNAAAVRYSTLTFDKVLTDKLNVMDATAIVMCRDNRLPLRVFNLNNSGDLTRIVQRRGCRHAGHERIAVILRRANLCSTTSRRTHACG